MTQELFGRKPKSNEEYAVGEKCTRQCSLHYENLDFSEATTQWYNQGLSISQMVTESERLGRKLSTAALSRHRQHLVKKSAIAAAPAETDDLTDLEVLRLIIKAGARRAHLWNVGPADTMKALDMYYRLTQGSMLGDLMGALTMAAAKGNLEDEGDGSLDAGSMSEEESEQGAADGEV